MEAKKRLIDANDVYALFDKNGFARLHVGDIDTIPRVDAVEVVHGRWKFFGSTFYQDFYKCSVCDASYDGRPNYCPNCGAKMDGDGDGND